MATVVGEVTHDTDFSFVNDAGETKEIKAGSWSVLSCPSGHTITPTQPIGTDVGPCPVCGL